MSGPSLVIVDVNSCTASETWPLLVSAIQVADFISLDLELSGLGKTSARDLEGKYKQVCDVAKTRAILSLGIACFRWETQKSEVKNIEPSGSDECPGVTVQVFNVWLLCQQPYTIDPSSAQFLVCHGFNFNKQYSQGLPYTPPAARTKSYNAPKYDLDMVMAVVMETRVPVIVHNGWLDLLFLYESCYGPLPHAMPTFLADLTAMFSAGIYDTKAIAQFCTFEEATFLEYLFRVNQKWSGLWGEKLARRFILTFPHQLRGCEDNLCTLEEVDIGPPRPLPLQQLLLVQVCPTFCTRGYCHTSNCHKSHDLMIAIEQRAHLEIAKTTHRKRKRKNSSEGVEADSQSCDDHVTDSQSCDTPRDMTTLFQKELATAKMKLSETTPSRSERGSHKSGLDAFMTGFIFTCNALHMCTRVDRGVAKDNWWEGLTEMKNCLANNSKSAHLRPLHIAKSQYSNYSATHMTARPRLKQLYNQHLTA